jgi:hypothetical protein
MESNPMWARPNDTSGRFGKCSAIALDFYVPLFLFGIVFELRGRVVDYVNKAAVAAAPRECYRG